MYLRSYWGIVGFIFRMFKILYLENLGFLEVLFKHGQLHSGWDFPGYDVTVGIFLHFFVISED